MIERRFTKAKRSHERPGDGYVNVPSWPICDVANGQLVALKIVKRGFG
jgi:hypothetical protein